MSPSIRFCISAIVVLATLSTAPAATFVGYGQTSDYAPEIDGARFSNDGSAIFGYDRGPTGASWYSLTAWWSRDTGVVHVGALPGHVESYPYGASFNGSVVVGVSSLYGATLSEDGDRAFRWVAGSGIQ